MAPFGSGGATLPSEMPAQLTPTPGAPGVLGPLGVVPGLRFDGTVPFALNCGSPFTPVRPVGRARWPDAAPAEVMEPIRPAASTTIPMVNNRRLLTEPPFPFRECSPNIDMGAVAPHHYTAVRASSHIRAGSHNSPSWAVSRTKETAGTRSASRREAATGRPR